MILLNTMLRRKAAATILVKQSLISFSNVTNISYLLATPSSFRTIAISVGCNRISSGSSNNTSWGRTGKRFTSTTNDKTTKQNQVEKEEGSRCATTTEIIYEGALAAPLLRLKLVSITTCALGLIGLPLTAFLYGASIPAIGQLAVGGTAIFATTGSTAALSYCLSPYVHTLERVVATDQGGSTDLIKATTRNIFAWKVETIFNPQTDVAQYTGWRPFCNFIAKGVPMYVHPELILDKKLCSQLVGTTKTFIAKEDEEENKTPCR